MGSANLSDIEVEDYIWIIYIFIAIAGLYANSIEKECIKNHNNLKMHEVHDINLFLISVSFIIYIYFVYRSYKNIKNLRNNFSNKKHLVANIILISSILFLVGGFLNIIAESNSYDDEEVAII